MKVFNSVGSDLMVNPVLKGGKPTMFYCGNDPRRPRSPSCSTSLAGRRKNMGTAVGARAVEILAQIWCIPGLRNLIGRHAFALITRQP